jgi:trimeric autotransporter adhesin
MKIKTSRIRNSMNRSSRDGGTVAALLIVFALVWFALSPSARAVDPPPDGGYAGDNTAEGEDALLSLTTGLDNTAIGFNALYHNNSGNGNTATGWAALFNNTTGFTNTAAGVYALISNTSGFLNTATGGFALGSTTTGFENTAIGNSALYGNTTGILNTASGFQALFSNTIGNLNTANGVSALYSNTTGGGNVATGGFALFTNTTGSNNVAQGFDALFHNTIGNDNIGIGHSAGGNLTTGNNNIDIGNRGVAAEWGAIRIGTFPTHTRTFIAGISGVAVNGSQVVVSADGKLGVTASSNRFKEAIKPMDKASEAIHALKPVTFRYKEEVDPAGIPQFGLVAEEVEKVNRDLVARDDQGKPFTVRYEAVNAMLLNEFLKEHRKNETQQQQIEALAALVKEQTTQIQKVRAQLAATKSSPQMVLNNQ